MNIIPQNPPSFKAMSQMGLHLVPMRTDGSKAPRIKWRDEDSATPERFDELTATFPETTAWGLLCGRSELLVIDIDRHGDSDGFEALGSVYLDLLLDDPLVVTTPSNGEHLYFRLPEGVTQRSVPSPKWYTGVDVKSAGGYVLAPGSRTSKGVYQIAAGRIDSLPVAPDWLLRELSALQAPQVERTTSDMPPLPPQVAIRERLVAEILHEVAYLEEGGRNNALFYKTRVLVERGLLNDYTEPLLLEAAMYSGLSSTEAQTAIDSAKN